MPGQPAEVQAGTFLRNWLKNACVDPAGRGYEYNLFGPFSVDRRKTSAGDAWDHPRVAQLRPATRDLLMLGGAFSRLMYGAVILYNVRVAGLMVADGNKLDVRDRHVVAFHTWQDRLSPADVDLVARRIEELPALGAITRHSVDPHSVVFVRRWADRCRAPETLLTDEKAGALRFRPDNTILCRRRGKAAFCERLTGDAVYEIPIVSAYNHE
jgi:hypothetical protein